MQRIKDLLTADDAVSPVIGVILMVAITVILAAVIAAFVLGIGDTDDVAPQSSFDSTQTTEGDEEILTIEIVSGDSINLEDVELRSVPDELNSAEGDFHGEGSPVGFDAFTTEDEWSVGESIDMVLADDESIDGGSFNIVWIGDGEDVLKQVDYDGN